MTDKKNVIIVMIDTLRSDHVGCYGNKWIKTPNLARLRSAITMASRCHTEGIVFYQLKEV
jgi:arylsulfatase A-like enzyme